MIRRGLKQRENVQMSHIKPQGNPWVFEENGQVMGYVWGENEGDTYYIEMVEVLQKGQRVGDRIVDWIWENEEVERIRGEVEVVFWNGAYSFWNRLGAKFEMEDGLEMDDYEYGEFIDFHLHRVVMEEAS